MSSANPAPLALAPAPLPHKKHSETKQPPALSPGSRRLFWLLLPQSEHLFGPELFEPSPRSANSPVGEMQMSQSSGGKVYQMGAGKQGGPTAEVYLIIVNVLQGVADHTDAHVDQV